MANHKNAEKCIRRIKRQTMVNKNRRSLTKTAVKHFESAIKSDTAHAGESFKNAQKNIMRAAQKGVLSKKSASRKISKLHRKLKAVSAS